MKKILAAGSFNIIHKGHIFFLKKAKSLGDFLVVIVATDRRVKKTKGFLISKAEKRKKSLEALPFVDKVRIGYESDILDVVEEEKPDIIALGYDQKINKNKLREKIKKRGLRCNVVRIKEELKGYKTKKILKEQKRI
jgi:FAD synthetase